MFDLEKMALTSTVSVNATDVKIRDTRTGKTTSETFFRPGKRFPFENVSKDLAHYGFTVMSVSDPTVAEGTVDWSKLFGMLLEQGDK